MSSVLIKIKFNSQFSLLVVTLLPFESAVQQNKTENSSSAVLKLYELCSIVIIFDFDFLRKSHKTIYAFFQGIVMRNFATDSIYIKKSFDKRVERDNTKQDKVHPKLIVWGFSSGYYSAGLQNRNAEPAQSECKKCVNEIDLRFKIIWVKCVIQNSIELFSRALHWLKTVGKSYEREKIQSVNHASRLTIVDRLVVDPSDSELVVDPL